MTTTRRIPILLLLLLVLSVPLSAEPGSPSTGLVQADLQWWTWALLLFAFTLALGVVAVLGGVGGGVLFVPIVSAIFPFHFDFVRGAGLIVALAGALSAGPRLLRSGLANLRLGLPFALVGSVGSIAGAIIGLALPTETVQGLLGIAIVGIVILMLISGQSEVPSVAHADRLSSWLGIRGSYVDEGSGQRVDWKIHRTPLGLLTFVGIGILAGMFGLGAGWANVPALNLLLGAPIKVAVATSSFILAFNDTAAAWVYLNDGAVLALIAVPSIAGMMIGTRIGAQILPRVKAGVIRWMVIA
ncbi:MAG: sulfite exporter TauE/SafE family protein, partial [Spirochaetaceae bacterium]|nr:sulfite exporter TauE/SafE family protein [Spirochaetaceae bacterium]